MNYLSMFNKLELDFFIKDKYIKNQYALFKLNIKEEYKNHFRVDSIHYGDVYLNRDTKTIFVFVFKEVSSNFYDSHYFYGFEFISTTIDNEELLINDSLSIQEMLKENIEYVGNIILNQLIIFNHIESIKQNFISQKQSDFIKSLRNLIVQKLDLIIVYFKSETKDIYSSINNLKKIPEKKFIEIKESINKNGFLLRCNVFNTKIFVSSLCVLDNTFGFVSIDENGDVIFVNQNDVKVNLNDSLSIKNYNYYFLDEIVDDTKEKERYIYEDYFLYLISQI